MTKPVATRIEVYQNAAGAYRLRMTDDSGQVVPTRIGHIVGVPARTPGKQLDAAIDRTLSRVATAAAE